MTTNVQFARMTGPYRTGEVAGFPDSIAAKLIADKAATLYAAQPHPDPERDPELHGGVNPQLLDQRLPPASASTLGMGERVAAMSELIDQAPDPALQAAAAAGVPAADSAPAGRRASRNLASQITGA